MGMNNNTIKVSVFGIGNFGFAILKHLDNKLTNEEKKYFSLYAFDRNIELVNNLSANRKHLLHHKDVKVSNNIVFTKDIHQLIDNVDILILAVISDATKEVVLRVKPYIKKDLIILNTAKALDSGTGERLSEVISNNLFDIEYNYSLAMLAGGTIASDFFNHEPLGIDIASHNEKTLEKLKNIFIAENLNVYTTKDIIGVEYASAFKNVSSIFAGIIEGLGFSYGSRTHMISRVAREIRELVTKKLGGLEETFSIESQCWGNDMWMSCTGNTRNREFGILIGQGLKLEDALKEMNRKNKTVEGANTIMTISNIIEGDKHNFPILCGIQKIVLKNADARTEVIKLMRSNNI